MIRQYKKYVAENRNIVYFSTFIALILRWVSFSVSDNCFIQYYEDGFLWNYIAPLFANEYVSVISAFLFSVLISFYMLHLNDKYTLIRVRTALPYAFSMFLLACFPSFLGISSLYFALFFVLLSIDILYSAYRKDRVADSAFRLSFLLALGSLFTFDLLIYVPLFWIGFAIMRSFSYKAILASLLGVFLIYWITAFCFVYFTEGNNPLVGWLDRWMNWKLVSFSDLLIGYWLIFAVNAAFIIFIIVYNYVYSYKDKVQIRAYISFVNFVFVYSLIIAGFLLLKPSIAVSVLLVSSSFIYSHYFALITQKGNIYFLIVVILAFLMSYLYGFNACI